MVVCIKTKLAIADGTEFTSEHFPGFDLVEQLEQNYSEKHFFRCLGAAVSDLLDEILTDAIRGPIGVRELEFRKDRIGCDGNVVIQPSKEDRLPLGRKSPVCVKHFGYCQGGATKRLEAGLRIEPFNGFRRNTHLRACVRGIFKSSFHQSLMPPEFLIRFLDSF